MKLDRLNALLRDLDLPDHRRAVSASGANLAWLQKHAAVKNALSDEIKHLLSLSIQELSSS